MNILIISAEAGIAGSTYSTTYLAKGLALKGHRVFLACPSDSTMSELIENTEVIHLPLNMQRKLDLRSIHHISQMVRTYKIDIINAQSSKDRYNTILSRYFYRLPVKLVHTRRQLSKSSRLISRFYEKGTDKVVAVSQGVKDSLVALGISAHHVHVIYNGTPPEKYAHIDQHKVAQLRQHYHIQPNDIVIGSVSRLKEQYQILEALVSIKIPVKVIFVGIEEQPSYHAITKQFSVPHTIYYTGTVTSTEVLPYYSLFTMNILATTIEGLSQSLLEAMALEVPVIATNIGGNPELIQHGNNGLLFKNGDISTLTRHIEKFITQVDYRKKLADKAKITALQDFSIEHTINRYESFFCQLLRQ